MKKSDFHFDLPDALIAQAPLAERSASRLLLVPPGEGAFDDRHVRDLPDLLQPGDLLVFNDTRVIPARLFGQKASGGRVEILIERLLPGNEARAQIGASKAPKPGGRIVLDGGGEAEVLARDDGFYHLRFHVDDALESWLLKAGRMPLPPYIDRPDEDADRAVAPLGAERIPQGRGQPAGDEDRQRQHGDPPRHQAGAFAVVTGQLGGDRDVGDLEEGVGARAREEEDRHPPGGQRRR